MAFIIAYEAQYQDMPTLREIGHELGRSHPMVSRYLSSLERQGYLIRQPGVERGIVLTSKQYKTKLG